MKTVTATEARVHLGQILRRVADSGEAVVVERGGKPQAVVVSFEEYGRLRRSAAWKQEIDGLRRVQALTKDALKGRRLPPPEDVIRQGRKERDAQLLDGVLPLR